MNTQPSFFAVTLCIGMFIGVLLDNLPHIDKVTLGIAIIDGIIITYIIAGFNFVITSTDNRLAVYINTKFRFYLIVCIWPLWIFKHYLRDLYYRAYSKYNLFKLGDK